MVKAYLIELVKKHRVYLIMILILALIIMPLFFIGNGLNAGIKLYYEASELTRQWFEPTYYLILISSILMAVVLNLDYFKMQSVDFYDSLPLKKEKRKMIEVLFGWGSVFLPFIVGYLIITIFIYRKIPYVLEPASLYIFSKIISGSCVYMITMFVLSFCRSFKEAFINIASILCSLYYFGFACVQIVYSCLVNVELASNDFLQIFQFLFNSLLKSTIYI